MLCIECSIRLNSTLTLTDDAMDIYVHLHIHVVYIYTVINSHINTYYSYNYFLF